MSEIALGFTEFHVSGQSSEAEDTASSCAAARAQEHKKIPTFTTGTAPVLRSGRGCERLAVSQSVHLPHSGVLCQGNSRHGRITDGKDGSWLSFPLMGKMERKLAYCLSVTGQLDLLPAGESLHCLAFEMGKKSPKKLASHGLHHYGTT